MNKGGVNKSSTAATAVTNIKNISNNLMNLQYYLENSNILLTKNLGYL